MLQFLHLSAVVAILSTQVNNSVLATQLDAAKQSLQASTSTLVLTDTPNVVTDITERKTLILVADSSSNTPKVVEKVGGVGVLLGIAAVGGAMGVLLTAKKANSLKLSSKTNFNSKEDLISIDQASRKLQKQILRLLHDDRDTANRLLSQVKMENPNRSIDWCVEKVIYDLDRDRGRY
jgi:hypothetical protein